jgi:hypothetical protein
MGQNRKWLPASVVELRNPKALNAIDETTLVPLEIATDLAILDETTEIAVLRGGRVEHPKYAGRRICSAGINLTHLYQGKIHFLFYFKHAMGYEHKIVRGVAREDASPIDITGSTVEKPWVGVVDVCNWWWLPTVASHGLCASPIERLPLATSAQGRDHSGNGQFAPAAILG